MVDAKSDRSFLDAMLGKHKEAVRRLNVYVDHFGKRTPMHPEPVAAALSDIAAPDAIFKNAGLGSTSPRMPATTVAFCSDRSVRQLN
jgi:hypothetical protein